MNRQEANREILRILSNWIEQYPDLRFTQILLATKAYEGSDFYIEPTGVLERMQKGDSND